MYCVAVDIISQYKKDTRRIENPHGEVHSARSVRNFQIPLYFDPSFAGNAWMTGKAEVTQKRGNVRVGDYLLGTS